MSSVLYQSIELLSREKGIEPQIVVGAVEEAIALATRKFYKTQENMRGELNKETGEITAYVYKTVVADEDQIEDPVNEITLEEAGALAPGVEVGSEIRMYKDTSPLGRIAAQLAKQVIFQKVREAERDTVFQEYAHREKEVLNATVKRIEGQDVIFDLGKAEARCPKREQSRLESFSVGERVRVVLLKVDRAAKGPQVIVSRAAPELVQNLFQSEVPEIYDSTVVIRAIAREAGERTKIAVMSRDKDVDPVGACVGMKGMRVQSIIRELRGEKIDIIEFSEEITTFAEKALQPAKVSRVSITDLTDKQLEVIVDDTQLSLAIGKKGQNVRLAAKLLGWKIDIKSEEEKRQEVEQQMQAMAGGPTTPIEQVTELGDGIIQKLVVAGITTVEALADMTPEQLEEIPGIGEKTLERISVAVRHYFGHFEEGEEGAPSEEAPLEGAAAETAAADTETPATGSNEVPTPGAAADTADAELENAQEALEEAEQERSAQAENDDLERASLDSEGIADTDAVRIESTENDDLLAGEAGAEAAAEADAEVQSMTAAELAVENVPVPDEAELDELDRDEGETTSEDETAE
ncbi:MAG TPA: transcription termination factor NusA [Terracidiphilus sp.]|jgi:N utilization substance protein A|nr:transcription termination factor NusA [Terracidiphilus sp.]